MKKTVKLLDNTISVDVRKFLDGKLLLQANTGGGKSWAIRRILEQLYDIVPQIILDTEGEFSTLRQKFDYILVGKGHEIPADYRSAGLLAHKMIESRCSYVIDLFEMKAYDRQMFVKNFVEAMTDAPKPLWLPTLLVVDEAQTYAPEGDKTETGRALHDAAFKFRKRHYGILFATPRIAALSKNVISTCKNKLIGYTSLDIDVKRAGPELGFTSKDQLRSLRDLDPGQFFAFGPAFSKEVIKVQIGKVETQHGEEGEVKIDAIKPSEKVKKALAVLATVPQAAAEEAKTVAELKKENTRLKGENTRLSKQPVALSQPNEQVIAKAVAARDREWEGKLKEANKEIQKLGNILYQASKILKPVEVAVISGPDAIKITDTVNKLLPVIPVAKKIQFPQKIEAEFIGSEETTMGAGERAVLKAIAMKGDEGATREYVTQLTGYKTSTRNTYILRLTQRGYVIGRTPSGRLSATSMGIEVLGVDYEPLPTGQDLVEHLMRTLPEGEKKVLDVLIQTGGAPVARDTISEMTGYKTSTRNTYIQRLGARELIQEADGGVAAAQVLFI